MTLRGLSAGLVGLFAGSLSVLAQNTVVIQGTTADSAAGKPVAGAVIVASRTTAPAARGVATSSFDGSFQMPNLPAGTYNLCVQVPGGAYLNTCHWGTQPTPVTVAVGQKSAATTLKLTAGSVLKIHVDDAGQLLTQKTKEGYSPDLVMGVWSGGTFYPARIANKAATAADYQVTVQFDASLKFSIHSRLLVLGNASKQPLSGNTDQQSFQHAAAAAVAPAGFSYSILSFKP
jgi:hypothetical protein